MTVAHYPDRHWNVVRQVWRQSLIAVAVTLAFAVALTAMAMWWDMLTLPAAIADAIFVFAMWVSFCSVVDVHRYVCIIPYFESPVGEIDTFCSGQVLAANILLLDHIAAEHGVEQLSDFGYNDDFCGEKIEWHESASGLETVRILLAEIESSPERAGHNCKLVNDLQKLSHALKRASDQGIRFSLLLRHGNSTSGLEWERRIGTAF